MKKVFYILVFVASATAILSVSYIQSRVPKTKGTHFLENLKTRVHVYYDKYGIPHIEGKSDFDVYKTLGYVMASERLFQMDLYRRLGQGRLSEIFGKRALAADKLLRTLRFKKSAQEILGNVSLSTQQTSAMDAFLEGVGEFIDEDHLPVEFLILGYKPEKFDRADIMAVTGYMALTFAEGINGDVYLSELQEKLPESKLNILRNGDKVDEYYFKDQKIVLNNILKEVNKSLENLTDFVPLFHGSNSWVLSGKRTVSGHPILANDPHIGAANPHIFFEAHIKTPQFEIYGNYVPLVPFPVMGHTPYSAWGLTMAEVDDFNVYLEKINPDDPSQVMYKNEWVSLRSYSEEIKIKDNKSVFHEVRLTPHGPLLDGTKNGVEGKSLSVSWSVYHPENNVLKSLYDIPRAQSVEDFKLAVSHAGAPGLNVSWVHKSGDIAWWMLGKYPKLPDGVRTDLVLRGWDGSQEIERFYSVDENPHLVNPDSGVIVTANYRPQQPEFAHFDGYWQPGGRYFRIERLLQAKEKWSLEELKKIQTDEVIPIYENMQRQLLNAIKTSELNDFETEVLSRFKEWRGSCNKTEIGCSIYHMWNYYNTRNAYLDEMGEDGIEQFGKTADFWHAYKTLVHNLNHPMWDNISTDRVESGTEQITGAFKLAVGRLREKLGRQIKNWNWGKLHTAEYVHPLGRVKPLNLFFNIGPVPANGGRYVINNLGHKKVTDDFKVVHGPATRRLIDMGSPEITWGILPTGNSGNFASSHFADQTLMYHQGEYREQLMDWKLIKKYPVLLFKPKDE